MDGAHVATLGNDGFGGELAHLELGALRVVFRLRLVISNRGVLVAREYGAAFFLSAISGADPHQFRLGGDGLSYVRPHFDLITGGIGALCGIWATGKYFPLAHRRHTHRVWRW
jgi:hypothetical protein